MPAGLVYGIGIPGVIAAWVFHTGTMTVRAMGHYAPRNADNAPGATERLTMPTVGADEWPGESRERRRHKRSLQHA